MAPIRRRRAGGVTKDQQKRRAANAALTVIEPLLGPDRVLGVGTGSTANHFIDALPTLRATFAGAVSSSVATSERLAAGGVRVLDLNDVAAPAVYVDGADEVAPDRVLIKGGGGALVREKIVAACAECFVCIVDRSKLVDALGAFPLAVEIVPLARRFVAGRLRALGGDPAFRAGFETDNGNHILDVRNLRMDDPHALENAVNAIPGVVDNGIFAGGARPQVVLIGGARGVERIVAEDCPPALRQGVAALA